MPVLSRWRTRRRSAISHDLNLVARLLSASLGAVPVSCCPAEECGEAREQYEASDPERERLRRRRKTEEAVTRSPLRERGERSPGKRVLEMIEGRPEQGEGGKS